MNIIVTTSFLPQSKPHLRYDRRSRRWLLPTNFAIKRPNHAAARLPTKNMALKNYTSKSKNTFDVIQKCLASHGAQKLMFDYNDRGQVIALSFAMNVEGRLIGFKLPARLDQVEIVLKTERRWSNAEELRDQAYRTGWANIRDWVTAQMALVDTRMAKVQEIFLPYMMAKNGKTLYESMEDNRFLLPGQSTEK